MSRKPAKDPYAPPTIVGDVDALPPLLRERGVSLYDHVIIAAIKLESRWIEVDPGSRTPQAFRNAMLVRLEQLEMEMRISQRGKHAFVRYDGETEGKVEMIERVRAESRAQYGD